MKLHIVIPWFGERSGGAEIYAHGLARALTQAGHAVEVLTTCCRDPFSDWSASQLPAGESQVDGLTVRRFPPDPRDAALYARLELKARNGCALTDAEERAWIRNSINSDTLTEFIGRNRASGHFIFLPYLYGVTFFGLRAAGGRGWLVPCLHNESAAYFRIFDEMFTRARGAMFLSQPEMDFARIRYGLPFEKCKLIRGGIETQPGDAERFRRAHGIEKDYLLYLGRLVPGKGADVLVNCYRRGLECGDALPDLVLIGEGEAMDSCGGRVRTLGYLPDQDVRDAMSGCLALCQPSFYESFSIVLLENWLHGRPAIVNAHCDVTREHCRASGGGLWFADSSEFRACVSWLREDASRASALGQAGKRYVEQNFIWPRTTHAVEEFIL
ncbi:glycosyltransferase family 4 protein [Candidatus Sumerlaeota bacterium]|nr:glycosyltransferase family 4 protein [Candidatus Sumerlaeota bacterium]